eukprot:Tbor_TRINITY_DN2498_c0_g1::TRINITY_DN2498_c0_g1_i1::g.2664::m.2664/K16781/TTC8, BBS8; tetratricopeptide repeat protein 8
MGDTATTLKIPPPDVPIGLDDAFYALSLLRRRKIDPCIGQTSANLEKNAYDLQSWYIKTKALTIRSWVDDIDIEEDGVGEMLLDEGSMAAAPPPGTSLNRGGTSTGGMKSSSGMGLRPQSGFARPGSRARGVSRVGDVEAAFRGNRPGTTRPVTTSGRFVRLGTASIASEIGGPFINLSRMDFKKYAERPALGKALCDYILYVEHDPKRAMELCSDAIKMSKTEDWWWVSRLGKCYYQLGLLRDAERQFKSSLKLQKNVTTTLELGKVYERLDQPLTVLDLYEKGAESNPYDHHLLLGMARIHDMLNDPNTAVGIYKKVLVLDASNIEAIACIGSSYFYADQPEIAMNTFRRLIQMGVNTTELWNNMGLACFYASQYDMALSCMDRALSMADDTTGGDVWYSVGHIAIGIGEVGLAYQAFKIACNLDPNHAEAFNNLAIMELRKGNLQQASTLLSTCMSLESSILHEPFYNKALLSFKSGDLQTAFQLVNKALEKCPDHGDSLDLRKILKTSFSVL